MKHMYMRFTSLCAFVMLFFAGMTANAQNAWINEFHYDNDGEDTGEFVEIVIANPGDFTLQDFDVFLYNGNGGAYYDSLNVADATVGGDSDTDFGIYTFFPSYIQNGNDGIAISYQGTLIQFISYEGEFVASDGPASGSTSEDLNVNEPTNSPLGESLQLSGTGSVYSDFTWQAPAAETPGLLNNSQTLEVFDPSAPTITIDQSAFTSDFGALAAGTNSDIRSFDVSGTNLTADISLTSEGNLFISESADMSGASQSISLTQASGEVASTTIYAQYQIPGGETANTFSATITASSTDATDQTVSTSAQRLITVTDIAALRAGVENGPVYEVTNEVIFAFIRSNSRNQKYIADASGSILIDDASGVITTTYAVGDAVTSITGTLSSFRDALQFVPTEDPGAPSSTDNALPASPVSDLVTIAANPLTYKEQFVSVEEVSFDEAGGTFANFSNFTLNDGTNTLTYRTQFGSDADLDGQAIPFGRLDVTAIGGEFNSTGQMNAHSYAAIVDNYAAQFTEATIQNETTEGFELAHTLDEPADIYYIVSENATETKADVLNSSNIFNYTTATQSAVLSVDGLNDNTTYYIHVLAVDANGNEQASVTSIEANTLEIVFDATSTITDAATPITTANVPSTADTAISAVDVFNFTIEDLGPDAQATTISRMVFNNLTATDLTTAIAGAIITDGTTVDTATTISGTQIVFDLQETFAVADASTQEFTLSIWLTKSVDDGSTLEFSIPDDHEFVADNAGSIFETTLTGGAVTSAIHTISVEATKFDIDAPASAEINSDFAVTIKAQDANGNIDANVRNISVLADGGTGTLSSAAQGTSAIAMTDGVVTYSDLQYDTEEEIIFTVVDDANASLTNETTINITAPASGTMFFSEYIEGSSNNKALEIYNGTGLEVDLTEYSIELYSNGATDASQTLALSDIKSNLAPGGILIVANSGADAAILDIADITSSVTFYNGDDAVALLKNGTVIDVIGEIGVDPGSAWDVAGVAEATNEQTLVRKSSITEGNPVNLSSFGTDPASSEWLVAAQNDFSNLGQFDGANAGTPLITVNTTGFEADFGFVTAGNTSDAQSYLVSAQDLNEDLVITAPANFELSETSDFATAVSTITLTATNGSIEATDIFVRFAPQAADGAVSSGDILHNSAGAAERTVSVQGAEGEVQEISILDARNDESGLEVIIKGIVTTPDYGFGNAEFYLQDETAGIKVFRSGEQSTFSPGDSVEVVGVVGVFNDEVNISASSFSLISSDNDLPEAVMVDGADLTLNSDLQGSRVVLNNVTVDATNWPVEAISSSSGVNVDATAEDETSFIIRIDRGESFYDGSDAPASPVQLTGILGRFRDNVQVWPFLEGDVVEEVGAATVSTNTNELSFGSVRVGEVSNAFVVNVTGTNVEGELTISAGSSNFEVSLSESSGFQPEVSLASTEGEVSEIIYVRFTPQEEGQLSSEISISASNLASNVTVAVDGIGEARVTANNEALLNGVLVYPNPTTSVLEIELDSSKPFSYRVLNLQGAVVANGSAVESTLVNSASLESGIYIIEIRESDKVFRSRIIKR